MQITEMCPNCGSELALDMVVSEIECPHCHLTLEVEINFDDEPDTPPSESAEDWTNHNVSTQIRIADPDSKASSTAAPTSSSPMPSTDTGNLIDSKIAAAAKNEEIKVAKPVQADFITSITEHERMAGTDALHVVEEEALRRAAETRQEAEEAMRAIEEAKRAAFADAERAKEAAEEAKRLAKEEAQRARDAAEEVKRAAEAEAAHRLVMRGPNDLHRFSRGRGDDLEVADGQAGARPVVQPLAAAVHRELAGLVQEAHRALDVEVRARPHAALQGSRSQNFGVSKIDKNLPEF